MNALSATFNASRNIRADMWRRPGRERTHAEHAPVDVLLWAHGLGDSAFALRAYVRTQGELDEDAAHFIVRVELLDGGNNVFDSCSGGKRDVSELNADFFRCLCLHPDIDGRVGTLASLDDGELGLETRALGL